jgi:hypothetical protein
MASNAALASPLTPPANVANKAIGQKDRRIRKDAARMAIDPTLLYLGSMIFMQMRPWTA